MSKFEFERVRALISDLNAHAAQAELPHAEQAELPRAYYALCDMGGPVSARLEGSDVAEAIQYFTRVGDHGGLHPERALEDATGVDGEGMLEEDFETALVAAGAERLQALPITVHLADGWSLWALGR